MIFSNRQMFFEQWEHQDYLDNYVYICTIFMNILHLNVPLYINIIFDEKHQL